MQQYQHARSLGGGDAPLAVQVNYLETDLKEATFKIQQAEERYRHIGSLVTRLWSGDYDAAVQLSTIFSLSTPGRWTDLGLQFPTEGDQQLQSRRTNCPSCPCCPNRSSVVYSRAKPVTRPLSKSPESSGNEESQSDPRDILESKPLILSPPRKFCSYSSCSDDYNSKKPPRSTFSQTNSDTSTEHTPRNKIASARTARSTPTSHTPSTTSSSANKYMPSYRTDLTRAPVPSRVLRNRNLYHSIPVVNIMPRNTIPPYHVANVIPSTYHVAVGLSRPKTSCSKLGGPRDPTRSRSSPLRQEPPIQWKISTRSSPFSETTDSLYYTDVEFQKTLARIYGKTGRY